MTQGYKARIFPTKLIDLINIVFGYNVKNLCRFPIKIKNKISRGCVGLSVKALLTMYSLD